jgi:septum formation protein
MRLILASQSPRRAELLALTGIPFIVAPSNCDEDSLSNHLKTEKPDIKEHAVAEHLALSKAYAALSKFPHDLILAADTIVTLDGVDFGKPVDKDDARRMLSELSGRTHIVDTGVALVSREKEEVFSVSSKVRFRPLSSAVESLIERYVETGLPLDKAGAYGIQELGGLLIERVEGDYFAVMGLPIGEVYERLFLYDLDERPDAARD